MSEDRSTRGAPQRSWMDRISHVLLGEPKDSEQLVDLLRDAERRNLMNPDALAMIEGVLAVSKLRVRDIMIPRLQMVVVYRGQTPEEFLPSVIRSAHSRIPVLSEPDGELVGILMAKDLLGYCFGGSERRFDLRDVMRPATVVPESKRLDIMLREFRSSRNHMAMVVDEYGKVSGLVTIEDVLEQIVGDIEDEHDVDEHTQILQHSEHEYTVKALTPVEDFNETCGADFSDSEFDTVGGLVLHGFGRVPERGEEITLGRFRFRVMRSDKRRVHLLRVQRLAVASGEPV